MDDEQTFASAVGRFVSKVRQDHELTLDQIARRGRSYGARWSASSVRNIERGQASLTVPTLAVLAFALGDLVGRPLTLADLLGDADAIYLAPDSGGPMARTWFDGLLQGAPVMATPDDTWAMHQYMRAKRGDSVEVAVKSPETSSLAEQRAATRLGISVNDLQQVALELWGRPLEKEARRRVDPGSAPQARGRATRLLVDEIRERLKRGSGSEPTTLKQQSTGLEEDG